MDIRNVNIPNPKEIEKEISDFLSKKYGDQVKVVSPIIVPQDERSERPADAGPTSSGVNFDLKPEELIAYLDQYIIKQDEAKRILSTKMCTHFNRIRHQESADAGSNEFQGR